MSNRKTLQIYFIIFASITLTALVLKGCSTSKKTILKDFQERPVLFAWNEDTVNSYQIALTKTDRFYYTILKANIDTQYYSGSYKGFDTIFLNFDKNIKPKTAENYLLREASGRYLIQRFNNDQKQIYFRIHPFR